MKNILAALLLFLAGLLSAQSVEGTWSGDLDVQGMKLLMVFKIKKTDAGYSTQAFSPMQTDKEIPGAITTYLPPKVNIKIASVSAEFTGTVLDDTMEGNFTQNGTSYPIVLSKKTDDEPIKNAVGYTLLGEREIPTQKLDDFLNYIEKNKQSIGSISIFRHGKEVYAKNFGNSQYPKANSTQLFQIGSVTKMMTAIMLMQQIEQGKLSLQDKLSKFYPQIPNASKITIQQMLNHTSGLGDYVGEKYEWLFKKKVGEKVILDKIKSTPVEFQPGENTRYSNSAYYLLSRILEKITKTPYHILLKKNIVQPLGLSHTFSVLDKPVGIKPALTLIDGQWVPMEDFEFRNVIGLGDVVSTPKDLNIFINGLFQNKLLKKESLEKMIPSKGPFGLGIMSIPFYSLRVYGHAGDTAGSHTILNYEPKDDLSIAMTINGENFPHNGLAIGIMSILYDVKNFKYPDFSIAEVSPIILERYVGKYSSAQLPIQIELKVKDRKLYAQATGQGEFLLEPKDETHFHFPKAGIKINMNPDLKGFTLNQGAQDYSFVRDK